MCKQEKSITEFKITSQGTIWPRCKDCFNELQRKKRSEGGHDKYKGRYAEKIRNYTIERKYGITKEQYQILNDLQIGVCAICKLTCVTGHPLSVDHDHDTGQVRGLLCRKCNLILGFVYEDDKIIYNMLDYIAKYSSKIVEPPPIGIKSEQPEVSWSQFIRETLWNVGR